MKHSCHVYKLFIEKLLLVFNRCDIEETGYLNSEALYQALLMLKLPVQLTDIEDILDSVGRKKEGTIGIDDFINIVHELQVCMIKSPIMNLF